MRKIVIGVMGSGSNAREDDVAAAFELGKLIAKEGWVLASGGRNEGVMDSVNKGARSEGGTTIGIIPGKTADAVSDAVDIPIFTGMGSARNYINVLSSDVVIACGAASAGTASEVALAIKEKKPVVLLKGIPEANEYFKKIGVELVHLAASPDEAVAITKQLLHG